MLLKHKPGGGRCRPRSANNNIGSFERRNLTDGATCFARREKAFAVGFATKPPLEFVLRIAKKDASNHDSISRFGVGQVVPMAAQIVPEHG